MTNWESSFAFAGPPTARPVRVAPVVVSGNIPTGGHSGLLVTSKYLTFFDGVTPPINGFTLTTARGTSQIVDTDGGIIDGVGAIGFSVVDPAVYVLAGESVSVSYDGTDSAAIHSTDGIPLAAFSNYPMTNNSTLTAPTVLSCTIDSDGQTVTVVFSAVVSSAAGTGFSLVSPSAALSPNALDDGDTWSFTSDAQVLQSDTPTLTYSPGTFALRSPAVPLASFSGGAVTNNSTQV